MKWRIALGAFWTAGLVGGWLIVPHRPLWTPPPGEKVIRIVGPDLLACSHVVSGATVLRHLRTGALDSALPQFGETPLFAPDGRRAFATRFGGGLGIPSQMAHWRRDEQGAWTSASEVGIPPLWGYAHLLTPDGETIVANTHDGVVAWSPPHPPRWPVVEPPAAGAMASRMAFAPAGSHLAIVWVLAPLDTGWQPVLSLHAWPGGETVWCRTLSTELPASINHQIAVRRLAVGPAGQSVVVEADAEQPLEITGGTTHELLLTLAGVDGTRKFFAAGRHGAAYTADGTMLIALKLTPGEDALVSTDLATGTEQIIARYPRMLEGGMSLLGGGRYAMQRHWPIRPMRLADGRWRACRPVDHAYYSWEEQLHRWINRWRTHRPQPQLDCRMIDAASGRDLFAITSDSPVDIAPDGQTLVTAQTFTISNGPDQVPYAAAVWDVRWGPWRERLAVAGTWTLVAVGVSLLFRRTYRSVKTPPR